MVREVADESAGQMAAMRKELAELRRDAAALSLGTKAARAAGYAEGWRAALESAEEAHARWGKDIKGFASEDEPGLRRLGERIREQAAAARLEAERGVARRQLLFHLGLRLPPPPPPPGELPEHLLGLRRRLLPPPPEPPPPPLPSPFPGTLAQAWKREGEVGSSSFS